MKIALAHDWVVHPGGAEKCLQAFVELYPEAPLHTLVYTMEGLQLVGLQPHQVQASFLQGRKRIAQRYRSYLPLFPFAIEQFDLSDYDVILSSSHCVAKGVLSNARQMHICYCHTPVRYGWDLTHRYLREHHLEKGIKGSLARIVLHYLRLWDASSHQRVDHFIANSNFTAHRIWRTYRRPATVIYPPVDTHIFQAASHREDYFLFISRLVPYKKADLVVEAFNKSGLPLVVVGDGPQYQLLRSIAKPNIRLMGYLDSQEVASHMARARALVFAAEEDFGIVPVEAQACGTPVIAFGRGGATETVVPADGRNWHQATGIHFFSQDVNALQEAIDQFTKWEDQFDAGVLRNHAQQFSRDRFKKQIQEYVLARYQEFQTQSGVTLLKPEDV